MSKTIRHCNDPRHATPCNADCPACQAECDSTFFDDDSDDPLSVDNTDAERDSRLWDRLQNEGGK